MDKLSQNQNTDLALRYHESTKHSEKSLRTNVHFLDGQNKPLHYRSDAKMEGLQSHSWRGLVERGPAQRD